MRVKIALIALDNPPPDEEDPYYFAKIIFNEWLKKALLAIASKFRGLEKADVLIICTTGSELQKTFLEAGFQVMSWGHSPLRQWRLWRWRKESESPLIIAFGKNSLQAGKSVLGKGDAASKLYGVFFEPEKDIRQNAIRHYANFICGSHYIEEELGKALTNGKNAEKPLNCIIIDPGIDIHKYQPRQKSWQPGERFVFGMAESLLPDSGALLTIRAMAALWLQRSDPQWEVRMFGSGQRYFEIMEEAEKLGVLPGLSILDEQPLEEVINYCHVWLAPGQSHYEQPQTLWAGFAAGLPVIASDSELHRERLKDYGGVLRVPVHNPQKLAEEMLKLMRQEDLRESLMAQARSLRIKIGLEKMADKFCSQVMPAENYSGKPE